MPGKRMVKRPPEGRFRAGKRPPRSEIGIPAYFGNPYLAGENTTNVTVTQEGSLCLPALYACVATIAKDLAALPFRLVQVMPDGGTREAREHKLYRLFARSPDGVTTPNRFRQTTMLHVLVWGNAYWQVVRSLLTGDILSIELCDPETVTYGRVGGRVAYNLVGQAVPHTKIVHIAGLSRDGIGGYSAVLLCRQAVALGLAGERFAGSYVSKGLKASAILETPEGMTPEAQATCLHDFKALTEGENTFGVAVLPGGVKAHPWTTDPDKAQLLEMRRHQVLEICRIFQVPPHKAMELENAAYSTITASNLEYAQGCLMPWASAIESAANLRLLTDKEYDDGYRFAHDFDALIRGDSDARVKRWQALVNMGVASRNAVAIAEGLQPFEGGDERLIPLNMVPVSADERTADGSEIEPELLPPGD